MEKAVRPYRVWWDVEANVARAGWRQGSVCTIAEARDLDAAVLPLGHGPVNILVNLRDLASVDRDARAFLNDSDSYTATAFLVSSAATRRIDPVIELLTSLACGDLETRGERFAEVEDLDGVRLGINMLAEEPRVPRRVRGTPSSAATLRSSSASRPGLPTSKRGSGRPASACTARREATCADLKLLDSSRSSWDTPHRS